MRGLYGPAMDAAVAAEIEDLALRFLDGRKALFDAGSPTAAWSTATATCRPGKFRLDDGPRVLDCLEFDERLR